MSLKQWKMKSPLGPIFLVASDKGLRSVFLKNPGGSFLKSLAGEESAVKFLIQGVKQLEEYFQGKRERFDIKLDLAGTPFQLKVWNQLQQIPFGQTLSYKDVAKHLKKDKAFRAVGTANGRNPVCIIVPCHRVISADGGLGGYSGGLRNKMRLLELEGIKLKMAL